MQNNLADRLILQSSCGLAEFDINIQGLHVCLHDGSAKWRGRSSTVSGSGDSNGPAACPDTPIKFESYSIAGICLCRDKDLKDMDVFLVRECPHVAGYSEGFSLQ